MTERVAGVVATEPVEPVEPFEPVEPGERGSPWWARWPGAFTLAAVWVVANVVWFERNRGSRLWDHEEVGYVRGVAQFGRLRSGSSMWDALHAGYTGPIQALLGAPSQWLFGVDQATVIWENVALTAVSVSRLRDGASPGRSPGGIAAAALTLFVPGMLENARGAPRWSRRPPSPPSRSSPSWPEVG